MADPILCGNCFKAVRRLRNNTWYHLRTASVSCRPGSGSGRTAFPAADRAPRTTGSSPSAVDRG